MICVCVDRIEKILLFVDNAFSHPHLNLKKAKVIFLPPNTTSVV